MSHPLGSRVTVIWTRWLFGAVLLDWYDWRIFEVYIGPVGISLWRESAEERFQRHHSPNG